MFNELDGNIHIILAEDSGMLPSIDVALSKEADHWRRQWVWKAVTKRNHEWTGEQESWSRKKGEWQKETSRS